MLRVPVLPPFKNEPVLLLQGSRCELHDIAWCTMSQCTALQPIMGRSNPSSINWQAFQPWQEEVYPLEKEKVLEGVGGRAGGSMTLTTMHTATI